MQEPRPTPTRDIEDRHDIEEVLRAFYTAAITDPFIGHFFTQVVPLDLEAHLPRIADFWESVLFGARGYATNVMAIHQHIHALSPVSAAHLDRWVALFTASVDGHYAGAKATLMKQRGQSIATMMNIKLNYN
jgi:hemoglobin